MGRTSANASNNVSAKRRRNFFPFCFALSPDYQASSAPRFFFCRRQKIFLLEKIPFAKANTPQPQTKCPHVCARVSHAARILERKTLRVKVAHRNATSRRGFFLRKFSISCTSWKGTRSRFFSNFNPSRRTISFRRVLANKLHVGSDSQITNHSLYAHTFHGSFPCLTILRRYVRPISRDALLPHRVYILESPSSDIFRSYHPEYSDTHQNIELKHGWAGLVLG